MTDSWGKILKEKKVITELVISSLILASVLWALTIFLENNERRQGTILFDPFLSLFTPADVTWFTFIILYGALIIGVIHLTNKPIKLILSLQFYSLLVLTRMLAMYFVALEPPPLMIPLVDPFVEFFTTGTVMKKDLFFSGHTATLFFLFLLIDKKGLKYFLFVCTVIVGGLILAQHVHYSIDVLAAPFFTYGVYRLVLLIRAKINLN
ncbi:MAG: hypothetical protein IPM56_00340 [Ignavibacteriales bacterium]|nr:MAG: hypothetical protein IPM56_00340 [Ignavibacteriales bacterium]